MQLLDNPPEEPSSDVLLSNLVTVTLNCPVSDAARLNSTAKPHTTTCRTRVEETMAGDDM